MAAAPIFFILPTVQAATVSATAYGGTRTSPTGLTTIYTASTSVHHQVRRIDFKGLGTSVAALLELWLYDGTTYSLLAPPGGVGSTAITAITGSTTQDTWQASIVFGEGNRGLFLPATAGTALTLAAGVSVTQTTAIRAVVWGAAA